MIIASGVSKGIGVSRAAVLKRKDYSFSGSSRNNTKKELERVDFCINEAAEELKNNIDNMLKNGEISTADMMGKYENIIINQNFRRDIKEKIMKEETSAEYAIIDIMDCFNKNVSNLEDEYLNEKCQDILEIKQRLLRKLPDTGYTGMEAINHECIIVAHEVTPLDILNMNPQYVKGIVTILPAPASSIGTLARKLNIPMVTGAGSEGEKIKDGDILIVDGDRGKVIVNPGLDEFSVYDVRIDF